MERTYASLVHRERPVSKRPHMELKDRAKIFAPFAALRGFDISILTAEKERVLTPRCTLSEQMLGELQRTLEGMRPGDALRIVRFVPQRRVGEQELGVYEERRTAYLGTDRVRRLLLTESGPVPLDDVRELSRGTGAETEREKSFLRDLLYQMDRGKNENDRVPLQRNGC